MAVPGRKKPSADALARSGLLLGIIGSLLLALGVFDGSDSSARDRPQLRPVVAIPVATPKPAEQARLRRWTQLQRRSAQHAQARRAALRDALETARDRERRRIARTRRPARGPARRVPAVRAAPAAPPVARPAPTRAPAATYVPPAYTPPRPPAAAPDPKAEPAEPGTGFDLSG